MVDFFNALSDFLSSDLAKGHMAFIVICAVVIFVIGCAATWFLLSKVIYSTKLNRAEVKEKQFDELEQQIKNLRAENEKLKGQLKQYEFSAIIDNSTSNAFEDNALDQFKRKD